MKTNKSIIYSFICLFLVLTLVPYNSISFNPKPPLTDDSLTKALVDSEPIIIIDDANFTDYGFSGTGTAGDPYRIENLNIITTEERGIDVKSTTKYFVIDNCYVEAEVAGIYVNGVAPATATISNNECNNHTMFGVYVGNSQNSTVNNNSGQNNYRGGVYHFLPVFNCV